MKKLIVVGIIILLVGMSVPSTGINVEKSTSSFDGNTLYVGGSGPGNYTKIQDAIDDASDGDTVYVYDESSPYYENIVVNKLIKLIGENKDTTIIDGKNRKKTIIIACDNVFLFGFCVRNSGNHFGDSGIYVESSNNTIHTNIIKANEQGIYLNRSSNNDIYENIIINNSGDGFYMDFSSNNHIYNNTFKNNQWNAITLENSLNNIIFSNTINDNEFIGIDLYKSSDNMIFNNHISNISGCGINIQSSCFNKVYRNIIENNMFSGIIIEFSYQNYIYQNNFKKNLYHNAVFSSTNWSHCKNMWKENYWNKPRYLPKPIIGIKILVINNNTVLPIPCLLNFDWHPSQKPW